MRDATRFHDSDTNGVSGNYGHGFAGLIDDVRVMNVAVDASEASTMMTDLPRLEDTATVSLTVEPAPTCFVSVNNSGITDYASAGASALQAAVNAANDGDLLRIAGTCTGVQSVDGTDQTVYISKTLTLQGGYNNADWGEAPDPDTHPTVLDAENSGRVVFIPSGRDVTLDGLVIKNGSVTGSGGGIQNAGTLTVTNSVIDENTATSLGGCPDRDRQHPA
jgi:hypothetical protein